MPKEEKPRSFPPRSTVELVPLLLPSVPPPLALLTKVVVDSEVAVDSEVDSQVPEEEVDSSEVLVLL